MEGKPRSTPDDMEPEYKLDYATAVRGKYHRGLLEISEFTRRLTSKPRGRSRATGAARPPGARRTSRR